MNAEKTYNGWTNYETWNVKLWMDNDQGSYEYWREQAQEAYSRGYRINGPLGDSFTREEKAAYALAQQLKDEIEESAPDLGASMFADLLGAALSEVNWHEIATSMIEDVLADELASEED